MKLPPHIRWPAFVAGALALQVVASLATIYLATSNPSYAVEDDYYRKALDWDAKRAQDRHNLELGWQLRFEVEPATLSSDQAVLSVTLSDPGGAPVDDALVAVDAFHNARADQILQGRLEGLGGGRYAASLPISRRGVWEFRFVAERGGDRYTYTESRHLVLRSR